MTSSKVKLSSHHDFAHLQPPTNVPPSFNIRHLMVSDRARTRFYRSMSLRQGQRSNQGNTMTFDTLWFLTEHGQDFIGQCHYDKVKGQIKVIP